MHISHTEQIKKGSGMLKMLKKIREKFVQLCKGPENEGRTTLFSSNFGLDF